MSGERKYVRQVVAYANYFKDFKKTLRKETLQKVYQVFIYIMTQEQVPVKFLKAITGVTGLYEIRVEEGGNIYRIFCCMDDDRLVILFNSMGSRRRAKRLLPKRLNVPKEL